jgi:hypothetical protein
MEAVCYPETSVDFRRTARRYTPEDRIILFLAHFPYFEKIKVGL